jgi:glyoxylase-like metal-dependent hydrolase (beta-lactamase superfamily II)
MKKSIVGIAFLSAVLSGCSTAKNGTEIKTISLKFTNCFLVPVESQYLLIDTGYDYEWQKFMEELAKNDIQISDIKYLLLTHHHDDHAGLLNNITELNPEVTIIASKLAEEYLAQGKHVNFPGAGYINKRIAFVLKLKSKFDKGWLHAFPKFVMRPHDILIENDCTLKDIDINLDGKILLTPGHTSDSITLLLDNGYCFTGDATANFLQFLGAKYCVISINDWDDYYNSWDKIIDNKASIIYPAHGNSHTADKLIKNLRKNRKENMVIWEQ